MQLQRRPSEAFKRPMKLSALSGSMSFCIFAPSGFVIWHPCANAEPPFGGLRWNATDSVLPERPQPLQRAERLPFGRYGYQSLKCIKGFPVFLQPMAEDFLSSPLWEFSGGSQYTSSKIQVNPEICPILSYFLLLDV